MKFAMSKEEWEFLEKTVILPLKKRGAKVWIFGSRAVGKHQRFSDVDLLISTNTKEIPDSFLSSMREELEESNVPYKVDIVRDTELAESYRNSVNSQKVLL